MTYLWVVVGKRLVINMPYYKTIVTVEVLSECEIGDSSLEDIASEIHSGEWSGSYNVTSVEVLSPEKMAQALIDQGSDPSFFGLDSLS